MSILIQGVRMPPKGKRLFAAVNGCGDVYLITSGAEIITKYQPSAKAIELPPHGRLIDADALNDLLINLADNTYTPKVFASWLSYEENAPTIIPAEGGAIE